MTQQSTTQPALDPQATSRLLLQQAIDECNLRQARYFELVAQAQAEQAQLELAYTKSQAEVPLLKLREAKAMERRASNALRPSVFFGAKLENRDDYWVAKYHGLGVRGDTPEIAMDNFDRAWSLGETDFLVETEGSGDDVYVA